MSSPLIDMRQVLNKLVDTSCPEINLTELICCYNRLVEVIDCDQAKIELPEYPCTVMKGVTIRGPHCPSCQDSQVLIPHLGMDLSILSRDKLLECYYQCHKMASTNSEVKMRYTILLSKLEKELGLRT